MERTARGTTRRGADEWRNDQRARVGTGPPRACPRARRGTERPHLGHRRARAGPSARRRRPARPRALLASRRPRLLAGRERGRARAGTARARARCTRRRRDVARRAHVARACRPRARSRASTGARRRHAGREPREVLGDRAVHRRSGVLRELRRDPRPHRPVQPDAQRLVAPSGRAPQRDRSRRRPVALALRPSRVAARATATTDSSCPGSTSSGARSDD